MLRFAAFRSPTYLSRMDNLSRTFASKVLTAPSAYQYVKAPIGQRIPDPVALEDMPFLHFGQRPRFRDREKFKSPRKRASKLLGELNAEAIAKSKESKPKVWETQFEVGDAIEIEHAIEGGKNAKKTEKVRGVVIGRYRKGLDESIIIQDVLFGEMVKKRIPLHTPMLRSIRVLERNFVYKGKRHVRRAKLYFLWDRKPDGTLLCASK
jgi:large subunit ribosomal protein L19